MVIDAGCGAPDGYGVNCVGELISVQPVVVLPIDGVGVCVPTAGGAVGVWLAAGVGHGVGVPTGCGHPPPPGPGCGMHGVGDDPDGVGDAIAACVGVAIGSAGVGGAHPPPPGPGWLTHGVGVAATDPGVGHGVLVGVAVGVAVGFGVGANMGTDRKSTRLNSSHLG